MMYQDLIEFFDINNKDVIFMRPRNLNKFYPTDYVKIVDIIQVEEALYIYLVID